MKTYVEPNEISLIENEATNLRDRLLIRILFRLGCRVSEALAMKIEDVDFTQGTVIIEHLKSRLSLSCPKCGARLGKSHTYCPKCGAKVEKAVTEEKEHRRLRTLPVDSETLDTLREYIDRGGPILKNGKRLIFGVNRHRAWQIVSECAKKAELSKIINPETGKVHNVSPHRLRDAFAVMAVQRDDSTDSIRMLQEQLGHVSIATTMRYRKVAGQELKHWYQTLWEEPSGT